MDEKVYQKIQNISEDIGIETEEKTIFEIIKTNDPNQKTLSLKSGSWESNEPWFAIDENKNLHTLVSLKSLQKMMDAFREVQQENFHLKLEKTIWQHIPTDFQDVWVVAMDEIKNLAMKSKNKNSINIDIERLVKKIKKKHPNLFINLQEMLRNEGNDGFKEVDL